ncbi:Ribosomal RNA small subunit methyltransferase E [Thalassocella blandensis]|nr:Ribosomal RNA small subunit methyltransferase E [Thalassocella blandensis]
MNLLILQQEQFISPSEAVTSARQTLHIRKILKLNKGDALQLGELNGNMGSGIIAEDAGDHFIVHQIKLTDSPPPKLPVRLILGMPRPQMIKRILQTVATMGVDHLALIQSSRVEKSFWQSPSATPESIHEHLILGLEQGVATQLPTVSIHKRFRPFVEDDLTPLSENSIKLIADPGGENEPALHSSSQAISLAIGPEGGFLKQEVEKFRELGFDSIHLGRRILKVETAVPVLLAKLFHF